MGFIRRPSQVPEPSVPARVNVRLEIVRILLVLVLLFWTVRNYARATGKDPIIAIGNDMKETEDIVTWDEHSLYIKGERVMIMSGEFHPWRLPVPSLWLDIFQKIKAMGFNCISFYTNWALLEGKPGNFTAEGVFAYDQFFEAATKADIYLIAVSKVIWILLRTAH